MKGFTLIELMVVIAIIGIFAVAIFTTATNFECGQQIEEIYQ